MMIIDRPQSYVGVSGVTTPEQARALLAAWPVDAPPGSLMIGVLASPKSMRGDCNARSPRPEDIREICRRPKHSLDYRALALIHYFTRDTSDLGVQLLHAAALGGVGCMGVQINVPWPAPEQIEYFQHVSQGCYDRVVLQIGPAALLEVEHNRLWIVNRLDGYADIITDVLLDVSAGKGKPLTKDDLCTLGRIIEAIRRTFPDLGIGIAGGLCAEALPTLAPLVREFDLSIDAEGRLRDDADQLDLGKTRPYQQEAARMRGWV